MNSFWDAVEPLHCQLDEEGCTNTTSAWVQWKILRLLRGETQNHGYAGKQSIMRFSTQKNDAEGGRGRSASPSQQAIQGSNDPAPCQRLLEQVNRCLIQSERLITVPGDEQRLDARVIASRDLEQ